MDNYDFLLDSRGDISFEAASTNDSSQLEFSFHYATSDSLLFNFFTEIYGTKDREPEMLQFNFNTYSILYDKQNKLISGDDYLRQAIRIQLETELGTLRENKEVGSSFYKFRHAFMNKNEVIKQVEDCVYNLIKDMVPDPKVKAYFIETSYFDFYNAIKVSVIFSDKTLWFTL